MQSSSRHVNEFKLFTGNSNRELAVEIAKLMGQDLGDAVISTFSDGEISVSINETVRGREIFSSVGAGSGSESSRTISMQTIPVFV